MELIKLFFVGATGYLLAGLYDVAIIHNKPLLTKIFYVGFFITAIPYLILFKTWKTPFNTFSLWIFIPLLVIFIGLLIYSVLLEFLLSSEKPGDLYTKGTYSFSRHPGFIWYTAINVLLGIYFWDSRIALLCWGFTLCNLILITVEDRVFFPKMFPLYAEYRKQTPFFLSLQKKSNRRIL